ncbi:hypothetical protein ACH5RR_005825 [Cinchona calisaya]|uniref:Auxin-responsive protein n=1 Tax=Cinchona calisaya TaxID=153742 RepID=A0ABD3AMB9_9GENT
MFKKRDYFLEAFEKKNADHHDVPQTLPLLVWDNDQNNQGDDIHEPAENSSDNGVVGWPPMNSWRKKICQQNQRGCVVNCVTVENGGGSEAVICSRGRTSMYVKVKMDGVGIARKVDLSLHHSHQTLFRTLVCMFGKCQESVQSYQLTFQDKEGDWQLAEDVNWGALFKLGFVICCRSFIRGVERLKLRNKHVRRRVVVSEYRNAQRLASCSIPPSLEPSLDKSVTK